MRYRVGCPNENQHEGFLFQTLQPDGARQFLRLEPDDESGGVVETHEQQQIPHRRGNRNEKRGKRPNNGRHNPLEIIHQLVLLCNYGANPRPLNSSAVMSPCPVLVPAVPPPVPFASVVLVGAVDFASEYVSVRTG